MMSEWMRTRCDTGSCIEARCDSANSCIEVRCETGNCVEVSAIGQGAVYLRSSLAPDVMLPVTRDEWDAFVASVKAGDFDTL